MPVIHITTELIGLNEYEFTQTWVAGEINVDERIFIETHEDRMFAAMTNLGYACKWFADKNFTRGDICIVTDTDGQDQRYSGEHNDLYKAIWSQKDYQDNRVKYSIIYGRYAKYLDRIRELANIYEIGFTQNNAAFTDNNTKVKEYIGIDSDSPYLIKNRKWTRQNIISIRLDGAFNIVQCNACQALERYNQTDNFVPFRVRDAKGRQAVITSNKHLVKNFQEIHLGLHINNETAKN